MSPATSTTILDHQQVAQKIHRIAMEIVENNFDLDEYYVIGVMGQGKFFAERLADDIRSASGKAVHLHSIELMKDDPLHGEIKLSIPLQDLKGKSVILADDVLNSGRTLVYAACHLLQAPLQKLQTACLIDRRHRRFPVRCDFVGLTLSTTLQDHIKVELNGQQDRAYLL